jgi:hypothetical protein
MRTQQQENLARRFSPEFDCELPLDLRRQLLRQASNDHIFSFSDRHNAMQALSVPPPSEPQAQSPSQSPPPPREPPAPLLQSPPSPARRPWAALERWALVALLIAALVALANYLSAPQTRAPASSLRSSLPQPAPASSVVVPTPAPRAVLIKLPPPHAQLVQLPEWKIDTSRLLLMPDGEKVTGTLRGFLGSESQLPRIGQTGIPGWWEKRPGSGSPSRARAAQPGLIRNIQQLGPIVPY